MAETEQERPVHVDINVSTGAVTHTAVTDEEWDELRRREQEAVAAEAQQAADDDALRAAVAAHPDPVVQALAKKAGLL
jgi:hypothetical protein